MAKPICVVYYEPTFGHSSQVQITITDANKMFEDRFPDYHVLAIPSYKSLEGDAEMVEIKVHNADNIPETEIEKLKEDILSILVPA